MVLPRTCCRGSVRTWRISKRNRSSYRSSISVIGFGRRLGMDHRLIRLSWWIRWWCRHATIPFGWWPFRGPWRWRRLSWWWGLLFGWWPRGLPLQENHFQYLVGSHLHLSNHGQSSHLPIPTSPCWHQVQTRSFWRTWYITWALFLRKNNISQSSTKSTPRVASGSTSLICDPK